MAKSSRRSPAIPPADHGLIVGPSAAPLAAPVSPAVESIAPAPARDRSLLPMDGQITISRPSSYGDEEYVEISVVDESSRVEFVEIRVKLADFARCVTGMGHTAMTFGVRGLHLVGTRIETKTEVVPRPSFGANAAEIAFALVPFEVDGWKGDVSDLTNGHRSNGMGGQSVGFRRHVDAVTGQPILRSTP